jgi:hypothetical protein
VSDLFASGRIIDLILGLVVLEALLLYSFRRTTGRGPRLRSLLPTLASGALLLLAMRLTIAGLWWGLVALPLALALITHVWDLAGRWRDG